MDKLSGLLALNSTKIKNLDEFILEKLNKHLASFKFDEDYLLSSGIKIIDSNVIKYFTCRLTNFVENRFINSDYVPNRKSFPIGIKNSNEYDQWNYNLKYNQLFTFSKNSLIIEESHHAKGCPTCKQNGKLSCSSCSGAGEIRCYSCDGRGEKICGNCNGKAETSCFWCSGKGRVEEGYGENKRTRNCNSCHGRGYNPCSSCRSGYITCSSCTGSGKLSCSTCNGSGEVTCYTCDGYRTLDNYFIVNAEYANKVDEFNLTNAYHGFDKAKSLEYEFDLYKVIYKQIEDKYDKNILQEISQISEFNRILTFLNFTDSKSNHLIKSRIEILENEYNEVTFEFYGEIYNLIFDKNFNKYYYPNRKPSDQYEFDMIKSAINYISINDLGKAKSTVKKISAFSFINISESELINDIDDTVIIYEAFDSYQNKKYAISEQTIKKVSTKKEIDKDYIKLKNKLSFIYFLNTIFISAAIIIFSIVQTNKYNIEFVHLLLIVELSLLILCILINLFARKLILSRLLPILFLITAHIYLVSEYNLSADKIKSEQAEIEGFNKSFEDFKKDKIIIDFDNSDESLLSYEGFPRSIGSQEVILLDEQQLESSNSYNLVVMPGFVEKWYRSEVTIPNLTVEKQRRVYSDGDFKQEIQGEVDFEKEIILRDWSSRLQFYAKIKDIHIIENTAVKFMLNNQENFKQQKTYTVYMPKYIYSLLKRKKSINKYNYSNIPSRLIESTDFFQNSQTSDNSNNTLPSNLDSENRSSNTDIFKDIMVNYYNDLSNDNYDNLLNYYSDTVDRFANQLTPASKYQIVNSHKGYHYKYPFHKYVLIKIEPYGSQYNSYYVEMRISIKKNQIDDFKNYIVKDVFIFDNNNKINNIRILK